MKACDYEWLQYGHNVAAGTRVPCTRGIRNTPANTLRPRAFVLKMHNLACYTAKTKTKITTKQHDATVPLRNHHHGLPTNHYRLRGWRPRSLARRSKRKEGPRRSFTCTPSYLHMYIRLTPPPANRFSSKSRKRIKDTKEVP